jgi:ubiquinone/menaquinone biosynthesis C-methylase UbiE
VVVGPGLEQRYGSLEGAAAYRRKYERSWLRRWSAHREATLLRWALAQAQTEGVALDVPCGAGRMVPVLLERARRVTAVDLSAAMVEEAKAALADDVAADRVVLGTASADALPFDRGVFDTAVCWRLLHHVVDRDVRVGILHELARVTRRAVIITFADTGTWKAWSERVRRRTRRCAMLSEADVRAEAHDAGLSLALGDTRRLSIAFSLLAVAVLRPAGGAKPQVA